MLEHRKRLSHSLPSNVITLQQAQLTTMGEPDRRFALSRLMFVNGTERNAVVPGRTQRNGSRLSDSKAQIDNNINGVSSSETSG